MKTIMIVVAAETPEEFILERIQQSYGLDRAAAENIVEQLKANGEYNALLPKAKASLEEIRSF